MVVEYLVVAAGGGAGTQAGISGAGGAGGYRTATGFTVTEQAYSITVGTGSVAANGTDSIFSTITSIGGGRGGEARNGAGSSGGSGGGGGDNTGVGGAGTAGQGYNGGTSVGEPPGGGGGGGGAASAAVAGIGVASSISGSSVTYATGGTGESGGNLVANTGNGGGGNEAGSSGIVIISYVTADFGACTGGTISTNGTKTVHKFTTSGTFTVVAASSAFFMFM